MVYSFSKSTSSPFDGEEYFLSLSLSQLSSFCTLMLTFGHEVWVYMQKMMVEMMVDKRISIQVHLPSHLHHHYHMKMSHLWSQCRWDITNNVSFSTFPLWNCLLFPSFFLKALLFLSSLLALYFLPLIFSSS